ncbi:hypothetical protein IQ243_18090 [Nostocales cyanobacterium LEGE 11386]|nr:hypothetical protein [Nostocales cyanobacterium LEGE 11386]
MLPLSEKLCTLNAHKLAKPYTYDTLRKKWFFFGETTKIHQCTDSTMRLTAAASITLSTYDP